MAEGSPDRRQRIHALVLALISQQEGLELLDGDNPDLASPGTDAAGWLERNRRVVQRYNALVRTAITLDALIDQNIAGHL